MSDEKEVLKRLAKIRNNPDELAKYNTPEWIWREVLASMRLSYDAVEQSVQSDEACTDGYHQWLIVNEPWARFCSGCGQRLRR